MSSLKLGSGKDQTWSERTMAFARGGKQEVDAAQMGQHFH